MSETTALGTELTSLARELDAADELSGLRTRFVLDDAVYLDGNSLGALPVSVPGRLTDVVYREWGELRIRSWDESGWWTAPERIGDRIAPLVGAAPGQIVVGDSTSVNVFKAVVAAVRMADEAGDGRRDEILVDATTFPTDGYIAESAARMTGRTLRPVTPAEVPAALSDRTAAVLLNHVDYRTGRLHDLPALTAAVHGVGARVVWDLCHSAGALPVGLDEHGVDLAVGCTYKYLNGGPGSPAYLYVRHDLQPHFDSPSPAGPPTPGLSPCTRRTSRPRARRGAASAHLTSCPCWRWRRHLTSGTGEGRGRRRRGGVTIESVRAKSLALTDFFLRCVSAYAPEGRVESLTPTAHAERGSQVALRCDDAGDVMKRLIHQGVIGDFRHPDVLRFGFTPLYVGFADAERAARVLGETLKSMG